MYSILAAVNDPLLLMCFVLTREDRAQRDRDRRARVDHFGRACASLRFASERARPRGGGGSSSVLRSTWYCVRTS